jgi:hypothetical protein
LSILADDEPIVPVMASIVIQPQSTTNKEAPKKESPFALLDMFKNKLPPLPLKKDKKKVNHPSDKIKIPDSFPPPVKKIKKPPLKKKTPKKRNLELIIKYSR